MQSHLIKVLKAHPKYASVLPQKILNQKTHVFDMSRNNLEFAKIDLSDISAFIDFINKTLEKNNAVYGAGGYGEDRIMYRHSQLFNDEQEPRSVHLAMDLWVPQGTPVFSPLPGRVHSFQNNDHLGDYGPTIILEHELQGLKFFTLYGHLSRVSLVNLKTSETIRSGQQIAKLGSQNENGSWPPHLHFQIISDMMGKKGDFPGVASISEKDYYLGICPDPNLILRLPAFFRKQF